MNLTFFGRSLQSIFETSQSLEGTMFANSFLASFVGTLMPLIALFNMLPAGARAGNDPIKVYEGRSTNHHDIICNISESIVYKGRSSNYHDIICNIKDDKVYKGKSTNNQDILYTVGDGIVYRGRSTNYRDILFTIRDGKVCRGSSSNSRDILYTFSDGKVYRGSSSSYSDIEFNYDGQLTLVEFVAVIHAVRFSF